MTDTPQHKTTETRGASKPGSACRAEYAATGGGDAPAAAPGVAASALAHQSTDETSEGGAARAEYASALAVWRAAVENLRAAKERLTAVERAERIAARATARGVAADAPAGLGNKAERNLDLWLKWKAGNQIAALSRDSGISELRVRQIVEKIERMNARAR